MTAFTLDQPVLCGMCGSVCGMVCGIKSLIYKACAACAASFATFSHVRVHVCRRVHACRRAHVCTQAMPHMPHMPHTPCVSSTYVIAHAAHLPPHAAQEKSDG